MIEIQSQVTGLEQAIKQLAKVPKQMNRAQTRAIRKTIDSVESKLMGGVAKKVGITKKSLKSYKRTRKRISKFDEINPNGSLWMGLAPLPAEVLKGQARAEDWGVSKGGYLFEGAFYRHVYGPQPRIWVRRGSRGAKKNSVYMKKGSLESWRQARKAGRLPVAQVGVDLDKHGYSLFEQMRGSVNADYQKRLLHEINWELSK